MTDLNTFQLGKYAKELISNTLTGYGFEVHPADSQNKSVDFIAITGNGNSIDIKVRSVRDYNYIFFTKEKYTPRNDYYAAIAMLLPGDKPRMFLIPFTEWFSKPHSPLFADHDYAGKKSKSEWGLNLSRKNMEHLQEYEYTSVLEKMKL
ncbi:MAG: DUF4365 domain-containing protein [Nitrospirae bacterium]|nr:DUF4365 domain-containing protein [Nitrospirota bacterium]